ncbi:flagellin-like protein [Sphingomonas sp. BIUV-7]|uniref:Flagellin-like protein n=1 Tax=Sphingomonas natans TaxID=3063330 RepID=A0ABT8YDY6_9SPHN|nr:flagellin-like protein [Sphingomonas sp. BIUV-7]MDO6416545.1 flagellin-like protein [Sphingomonas sp. BIUV-7]
MIGATRYIAGVEIQRQTTLSADISKLQQSISSNKRLSAASDDPKAAARIADIRQNQSDNAVWLRNTTTGAGIAKAADTALSSLSTMLQRAKELVIAGANDTNANVDRAQIATELRSIAGEITALSQTKDSNGQALFPTGDPILIPVSAGRSIAATTSAKTLFGTVPTEHGDRSMAEILTDAAAALEAGPNDDIPYTDSLGNTTDADCEPLVMTRAQALTYSVATVNAADDHAVAAHTDQGLRAQRFDDTKDLLTSGTDDLKIERSSLEDTDLTQAVSEYQAKSLALQAAQTIFAQSHKSTLFDLLG